MIMEDRPGSVPAKPRAPWYRSMMFVPGHRGDWMRKAPKYGADALVFDLDRNGGLTFIDSLRLSETWA